MQQSLAFLGAHRQWAYLILFLAAYFETVVPFSLVVMGEVFFLSGALLAGMGTLDLWGVVAALCGGGVLGDNSSYWIGHHYGAGLFERLSGWPIIGRLLRPETHRKGVELFRRHGPTAVFTARLSGPLSWITPALAGIFRLNYLTFLRFNTPAVLIGIGEFVIAGYYFGKHLDAARAWLVDRAPVIALIVAGWLALFMMLRRYLKRRTTLQRDNAETREFGGKHGMT